jgi:predicted ATPase
MLNRLYIDNWRCFTNYEMTFGWVQCLAGSNGTGKSSLLDLLNSIRKLIVDGQVVSSVFPAESLTRWLQYEHQEFQVDIAGNGGTYRYWLSVKHDRKLKTALIEREMLTFEHSLLFDFNSGTVQLFSDDFAKAASFKFDATRSALGVIGISQGNARLDWFRQWFGEMRVVRLNPFEMTAESEIPNQELRIDGSNFASWYHGLVLFHPEIVASVTKRLQCAWPAFSGLRFDKAGERVHVLKAEFSSRANGPDRYLISELSDGQRCLLVLHALIASAELASESLLAIDEPVNFVALPEIQPLLGELLELAGDHRLQLILSGHHPELLDFIGSDRIQLLLRSSGGAVEMRPFATDYETLLTPSELIARSLEPADA